MEPPITTSEEFDNVGNILDVQVHKLIAHLMSYAHRLYPKTLTIIDAGCGTGTLYGELLEAGIRPPNKLILIDINDQYLTTAERNAEQYMHSDGYITTINTDLRIFKPRDIKCDLLLFTNTTGFLSVDECIHVINACNPRTVITNMLFRDDNILRGEVHPLTRTPMLLDFDGDRTFTWDLSLISGEKQSRPFSLQASSLDEWYEKLKASGLSIDVELVYRDFKAERMFLLRMDG